ncbi:MAG TPA: dienelactone hydrolase family protein [Steroidobacteraceae bacterium]
MRAAACCFITGLLASVAIAEPSQPTSPQTVEILSGNLHLKAYLWTPAGRGPFPAVLFNHGRSDTAQQHWRRGTLVDAAEILGPVFARHGYVFLFPFRRGEGPSADQGRFVGDLLQQEEDAHGVDARMHLQITSLTTDHLDDGVAGLLFLKRLRQVDAHRIAVAGHSFGGQLTLLEAERDPSVRAAVTFGAAAGSWDRSEEIRSRMLAAVDNMSAPVLLLHAENDYSVAPGKAMASELARLSKPYALKIYPRVGESSSDGHNFLYTDVPVWENDVFKFLDEHTRR